MTTQNRLFLIGTLIACLAVFSAPVSLQAFQDPARKPPGKEEKGEDAVRKARAEKEKALVQQYRMLNKQIAERQAKSDKQDARERRPDAPKVDQPDVLRQRLQQRIEDLIHKGMAGRESGLPPEAMKEIHDQIQKARNQLAAHEESMNKKTDRRSVEPKRADQAGDDAIKAALRRVEHLHQAAKHLKEAEVHELAAQVMARAEQMTARIHAAQADARQAKVKQAQAQVAVQARVRADQAKVRAERVRQAEQQKPRSRENVDRARTVPTSDDLRALIAEVRKLRADVNEIRAQINKKDR